MRCQHDGFERVMVPGVYAKDMVWLQLGAFRQTAAEMVVTAAKLISPYLQPGGASAGFQWCQDELFKAKLAGLAHDVMMAKATYFLTSADVDGAASVLKQFERHGGAMRIKAATNLSFLYSLEGNTADAARYSELVMSHDEFHVQVLHLLLDAAPAVMCCVLHAKNVVQALVNAGNCKLEQGLANEVNREESLSEAWSLYEAALKQEPDCIEAIYNMSLAAKAMEQYDLALEQLIMLNGLVPNQVRM
jgi:intraflagellar transport protein 88